MTHSIPTLALLALPAFNDNYLWLLHNGTQALVVDPGDAAPVQAALTQYGLTLSDILITHHHADHVGGVDTLRNATGARVWGPAFETIPEPVTRLTEGESCTALGLTFDVIDVPGHTAGHIAYFCRDVALRFESRASQAPLLFCGDTLFSGGCGRLFEGSPAQMLASLDKLAALPGNTRVCCTHEYTLSNLRFAVAVEPDNTQLADYQAHCMDLRAANQITLPSSIAQERAINPFLRSRSPAVVAAALARNPQGADEVGIFATIREWKNTF